MLVFSLPFVVRLNIYFFFLGRTILFYYIIEQIDEKMVFVVGSGVRFSVVDTVEQFPDYLPYQPFVNYLLSTK